MRSRIDRELAINAVLMAVSRRKPQIPLIVHSDQGSQYSSHDWQDFHKAHGLIASMSRRGNCYDNALAKSFFQLLKESEPPQDLSRPRRGPAASLTLSNVLQPQTTSWVCKQYCSGRVRKPVFQPAAECLLKPGRFSSCFFEFHFRLPGFPPGLEASHSSSRKAVCLSTLPKIHSSITIFVNDNVLYHSFMIMLSSEEPPNSASQAPLHAHPCFGADPIIIEHSSSITFAVFRQQQENRPG